MYDGITVLQGYFDDALEEMSFVIQGLIIAFFLFGLVRPDSKLRGVEFFLFFICFFICFLFVFICFLFFLFLFIYLFIFFPEGN